MGLVKAEEFLANLALFRVLSIRGRLGGGKTLAAVAIAEELERRGFVDGSIANFPSSLSLPSWRQNLMRNACLLFDEAWQLLDNRTSLSNPRNYGAFARKLGTYWLFPSVIPLDKRVSYMTCERDKRYKIPLVYSLFRLLREIPGVRRVVGPLAWLGDEIWVYKWFVELGYIEESGTFWLVNPERYFTMYDNMYIPIGDAGISALWKITIESMTEEEEDDEEAIRRCIREAEELGGGQRTTIREIASKLSVGLTGGGEADDGAELTGTEG